jgi:hypothetical protein
MPNELRHVNLGRTLLDFLKYYAELDVKKFAIACSTPGHPNSRLNTYPIIDLEQTVSFNTSKKKIVQPDLQHADFHR